MQKWYDPIMMKPQTGGAKKSTLQTGKNKSPNIFKIAFYRLFGTPAPRTGFPQEKQRLKMLKIAVINL